MTLLLTGKDPRINRSTDAVPRRTSTVSLGEMPNRFLEEMLPRGRAKVSIVLIGVIILYLYKSMESCSAQCVSLFRDER